MAIGILLIWLMDTQYVPMKAKLCSQIVEKLIKFAMDSSIKMKLLALPNWFIKGSCNRFWDVYFAFHLGLKFSKTLCLKQPQICVLLPPL